MEEKSLLHSLFTGVSLAEFCSTYFAKIPFSSPSGARELCSLLDTRTFRELSEQKHSDLLFAKKGKEKPPSEVVGGATFDGMNAAIDEGFTVVARHVDKSLPAFGRLAGEFSTGFNTQVDVQIFWSPPANEGFNWHFDVEDVFIVQTKGSKEFTLRKNTVFPMPVDGRSGGEDLYPMERSPTVMRCTLAAGDWLYIPSGYWHKAAAIEESMHISIGIMPLTYKTILDSVSKKVFDQMHLRKRLDIYSHVSCVDAKNLQNNKRMYNELESLLVRTIEGRL